jgi:uncharacterized membrane protein/uncharacterized protein YhjY with autotransporter beta-barrel domain
LLAAMAGAPAAAQTSFQGFGALPGAEGTGRALAVSGDGSIVVGHVDQTPIPYGEAFRWTATGGMESLGFLPGAPDSHASAISADGTVIVGDSNGQAFRWTAGAGMQAIGPGQAFDASADGSVVVGATFGGSYRWTQAGGMVLLASLPGEYASLAKGVSDAGDVVIGVGYTPSSSLFAPPLQQAYRWTQATGTVALGSLAIGEFSSDAYDISGDGQVIVGAAENGLTWEAFRWMQAGGMVGLGVPAGAFDSYAYATNFNGTVVVGKASDHATVWTEVDGMRYVADVLTASGVDLTGWDLQSVEGVSDSGEILVGIGRNPDGVIQPWIVNLDLGLVTFDNLARSLGSVVGVAQSAQQVESAHLGGLIDLSSTYGAADAVGAWSAWGGFSFAQYNVLNIDPQARQGDVGFAYQLARAWRVGAGVRWGGRDDDVLTFEGKSDSTYAGVSLFAAYAPAAEGLRVDAAFAANSLENDVTRGYLNGSALTSSSGTQDGAAYGAALRVGWATALSERATATPFVAYEASRIELDGYTETTGPFPARFNDADGSLAIARAGVQVDVRASDAWRFWVSGDYARRGQSRVPGVSGEVIALASPFAIEGAAVNREWWEAGLGAEWRASERTRLQFGVNGSSDGDTAAHFGARVSAIVAL